MKIRDTQAYIRNLLREDFSGHVGAENDPLFKELFASGGEEYFIQNVSGVAKNTHQQVFYELLQNASDANATKVSIFFDDNQFLAINNGDAFVTDGSIKEKGRLRSFLGKNKSAKNPKDIGKHGQGSKLLYDLLTSSNIEKEVALKESLEKKLDGLIICSWNNEPSLNELLYWEGRQIEFCDFIDIDNLLVTKLIYTYYPSYPGEEKLDKEGNLRSFFSYKELKKTVEFLNAHKETINISDFNKGTLIYGKLGDGRGNKLTAALNQTLFSGIQISLSILPKLNRVTVNGKHFNKISNSEEKSFKFELNGKIYSTKFILPNVLKDITTDSPNFFQYFPITESNHGLKYIIHSDAYRIEGSRQSIDYDDTDNQNKLISISNQISDYYSELVKKQKTKKAIQFINCLLATDIATIDQQEFIKKHFFSKILNVIKENLPTSDEVFKKSDKVIFKDTRITLSLATLGYSDAYWLHEGINDENDLLKIERYTISDVIENTPDKADCDRWISSLTDSNYQVLFEEIGTNTKLAYIKLSNKTICSIEDIHKDEKLIPFDVRTKHIKQLLLKKEVLLGGIGFDIKTSLDDEALFNRLNTLLDYKSLTKDEKWQLFKNYSKEFKQLPATTLRTKLRLFANTFGKLLPLSKLLIEDSNYAKTGMLRPYKINPIEVNQYLLEDYFMKESKIWKNLMTDWKGLRKLIEAKNFIEILQDLKTGYNAATEKDKSIKFELDSTCLKSDKGSWITPNEVFYNIKLTQLSTEEHYSLKVLIERISDYQILSYEVINDISNLDFYPLKNIALSGLKSKIKTDSCAVSEQEIKLLYQFKHTNEQFFNHFSIYSQNGDYLLKINDNYKKQFYANDRLLNAFLEDRANYVELPTNLYPIFQLDDSLHNITQQDFIEDLITEFNAHPAFIDLVLNASTLTKHSYLENTARINYSSEENISTYQGEYRGKIIKLIVSLEKEETFKDKIYIDDKQLRDYTYEEEVKLKDGKHTFSLSQISNQKKSSGLSIIKDRLEGIAKGDLFDQEPYPIVKIVEDILGAEEISITKVIFLLIALKDEKAKEVVDEKTFEKIDISNISQVKLLEALFEKRITWFEKYIGHQFLEPSKYISTDNRNLILENESVPIWVEGWMDDKDRMDKYNFLSSCKLLTSHSSITRIREAIYKNEPVNQKLLALGLTNLPQVNRTLKWIVEKTGNHFSKDRESGSFEKFKAISKIIEGASIRANKLPKYLLTNDIHQKGYYELDLIESLQDYKLKFVYDLPSDEYHLIHTLLKKHNIKLIDEGRKKEYRDLLKSNDIESIWLKKEPSTNLQTTTQPFEPLYYKKWREENENYEILLSNHAINSSYSVSPDNLDLGDFPSDSALYVIDGLKKIIINQKNPQEKTVLDCLSENQQILFGKDKDKLVHLLALANKENTQYKEIAKILEDSELTAAELPVLLRKIATNNLDLKTALTKLDGDTLGNGTIDLGKKLSAEQEARLKESIDIVNQLLEKIGSRHKLEQLLKRLDDIESFLEEEDESSTPNQIIGHIGEVLIKEWLEEKGHSVNHKSIKVDKEGNYIRATYTPYDIELSADNIKYLIDVKTTIKSISLLSKSIAFYISKREYDFIMEKQYDNYFIIRISLKDIGLNDYYSQLKKVKGKSTFEQVLQHYHKQIVAECKMRLQNQDLVKRIEDTKLRFKVAIPNLTDSVPF